MLACDSRKAPAAAGAAEEPQPFEVLTLEPHPITLHIELPATVVGRQTVEIRPMIDGYIEAIYVDEGAWVKAGQKLFKIKAPQYEQAVRTAEAGIKTAEAAVSSAQMAVVKVRPLVEKQIISEFELREAQFKLNAREAELAQAKAALVNARTNLGYTIVSSPAHGVIGNLLFKIGTLVSSNMELPLTTVSDIEEVYAYFSVNEKVMLSMTRDIAGNTFQEKLAKMPEVMFIMADGKPYDRTGRVQAASGLINRETGSSNFRATFPNPHGLLRSGASGLVRIPRHLPSALLVPQRSTYELQGKHFVYEVATDGQVAVTEISVRPSPDGKLFVVHTGLDPGDRVVLDGLASLKAGMRIRPVAAQLDLPTAAP